jgi:DTW domain-containing protein YfiP
MCLIMCDIEPLKPTNTGWLIADVVQDTFAFGWARTEVDPELLTLLADPQWMPLVVFPAEFVAAQRVLTEVPVHTDKRPLFILLDGTWAEACKMMRKSPYLNHLPVLSLHPEKLSSYRLRRSKRGDHLCTSEVAAMCLALAGEPHVAEVLETYLDVFTNHYLNARQSVPPDLEDSAHQRLRELAGTGVPPDR